MSISVLVFVSLQSPRELRDTRHAKCRKRGPSFVQFLTSEWEAYRRTHDQIRCSFPLSRHRGPQSSCRRATKARDGHVAGFHRNRNSVKKDSLRNAASHASRVSSMGLNGFRIRYGASRDSLASPSPVRVHCQPMMNPFCSRPPRWIRDQ